MNDEEHTYLLEKIKVLEDELTNINTSLTKGTQLTEVCISNIHRQLESLFERVKLLEHQNTIVMQQLQQLTRGVQAINSSLPMKGHGY